MKEGRVERFARIAPPLAFFSLVVYSRSLATAQRGGFLPTFRQRCKKKPSGWAFARTSPTDRYRTDHLAHRGRALASAKYFARTAET
jgi:hypothetical protein